MVSFFVETQKLSRYYFYHLETEKKFLLDMSLSNVLLGAIEGVIVCSQIRVIMYSIIIRKNILNIIKCTQKNTRILGRYERLSIVQATVLENSCRHDSVI